MMKFVPAIALLATVAVAAQPVSQVIGDVEAVAQQPALEEKRVGIARFLDPEDGQFDLSYFLAEPRGVLPVPIVVTEPAVGPGGGAAGMFLRPRSDAGDEGFARPDIAVVGALATENGTWGAFGADMRRWVSGRLRTLLAVGTGRLNLDFYGLGLDQSSLNTNVRYSLDFSLAIAQANWQLAPKSPWAIGLRYVYADVEPVLRDEPVFPNLADRIRIKISAPSPILEFDTRDNVFTPTRGLYSETSWLASRKTLGATSDFDRLSQVLIGWYPASADVTLGARGLYGWSSGGTPFFLRPFIQLRGVPALRYQGDQAASIEVEASWRFQERWSVVAFGGAGTARTDQDAFTATQNVGAGGLGFRYEIARKFGMSVGVDVAHSPGTTAAYLVIGNAWFRP